MQTLQPLKLDKTLEMHIDLKQEEWKMEAKKYFEQGYEKQTLEQYKEAIEDYNKALELDKDFERAYIQRACCKMQLKDYKSAIPDYEIAIKLNPNDPITFLNISLAHYHLGTLKDTNYLDKAIELDSDNMVEAHFLKGSFFLNKEKYEDALIALTKAIEIDPTWLAFYLTRAVVYERLNKYQKALDDYLKIKEINPVFENIDSYIEDCKKQLANNIE